MATFTFNIAKGRVVELYNRVQSNDPAASQLVVMAVNSTATQATLEDLDTVALVLADANTAEVTNTNYARIDLDDTDLSAIAANDTDNRMDIDLADQTFSSIAAGDAWTHIIIAYDSTGSAADSALVPLTCHDFAATPDGNDIVVQIADFFRAS